MVALDDYNRQAADLPAGRRPRARGLAEIPTVRDLANSYLAARAEMAQRKLITPSHFNYCTKAVKALVGFRAWKQQARLSRAA